MDIELKLNSLSAKQRNDLYNTLRKVIPAVDVAHTPQYGRMYITEAHLGHYISLARFINYMPSLMRTCFINDNRSALSLCIIQFHIAAERVAHQGSRAFATHHKKLINQHPLFKASLNIAGYPYI